MKKLGPQGIKVLKIVHLFFAVLWIGGAIGLLAILFLANPTNGDELYMSSRISQIVDDFLVIPGAIGSFFIGIVYGVWTNWGFFKHRWLVVKWIVTVAQILFGTFALGPWIDRNVEIAYELRDVALTNAEFLSNLEMSRIYGSIQTLLLVAVFLIVSVVKPWRPKRKA